MNIAYIFKEGISGFKRAKLATTISIFTITISLILLGLFYIIYANTNDIVQSLRNKVEMEVFLEEPLTDTVYHSIEKNIISISGIQTIKFISKSEAAKIFHEEFGEDINSVLDFNPLPPSFKIYLEQTHKNSDSAIIIYNKLKTITGIDDVIYRKSLLELLDSKTRIFIIVSFAIGIILIITSTFLVSNTIRLTIYAKRKIINTMKLVGATGTFIRTPFLLEGIIQGILGGTLAGGIIYVIVNYTSQLLGPDLSIIVTVTPFLYIAMLIIGTLLGFIGSLVSVRKFISETIVQ